MPSGDDGGIRRKIWAKYSDLRKELAGMWRRPEVSPQFLHAAFACLTASHH
jgi:hypothetical protein